MLLRRPRDSIACMIAGGAAIAIIVNGVYLQHGPHPAPIFAIKPLPVALARDTVGSVPGPRPPAPGHAPRRRAGAQRPDRRPAGAIAGATRCAATGASGRAASAAADRATA